MCGVDASVMHLPKWRKATWAIAIWSALMSLWIVVGGGSAASSCSSETGDGVLSASTAQDACTAGAGIGIAILMVVAFVGFVFFSLIWIMSRPKVQQVVVISPEQAAAAGYAPIHPAPALQGPVVAAASTADALDFVPLTAPAPVAMTPRAPSPPGSPLGPYGR